MFVIYIHEFAKSCTLRGNVIKLIVSYVDCVGDVGQNNNYLGLLSAWVVGSSFLCMSQKSLCKNFCVVQNYLYGPELF